MSSSRANNSIVNVFSGPHEKDFDELMSEQDFDDAEDSDPSDLVFDDGEDDEYDE